MIGKGEENETSQGGGTERENITMGEGRGREKDPGEKCQKTPPMRENKVSRRKIYEEDRKQGFPREVTDNHGGL